MLLSRGVRIALRVATGLTLAFIYLPIALIVLYSFNAARVASWPISGLTLDWYARALGNAGVRLALRVTVVSVSSFSSLSIPPPSNLTR